jgi:hypothetical protein
MLARLMEEIPLSAEPGAKRRKDRLSVPDEIRYSQVGIHHPIFVENRGRCAANGGRNGAKPRPREDPMVIRRNLNHSLSAVCAKFFFACPRKETDFLEFHDDQILDPTKAAAETVLAVDPEKEIAVQTVETDPLGIYPSSDSSEDSVCDELDNGVHDGVLLEEESWLE